MRNLTCFLGTIFLCILISLFFIVPHYFGLTFFVEQFIISDGVPVVGSLLGLNIATTAIVMGNIYKVRSGLLSAGLLTDTMNQKVVRIAQEVKHNIMIMLASFIGILLLNTLGNVDLTIDEPITAVQKVLLYCSAFLYAISFYNVYITTSIMLKIEEMVHITDDIR